MRHAYTITLSVVVTDPRRLRDAAVANYLDENPNAEPSEYEDFFGPRESPNIEGCLRGLADPGVSWPGTEIEDSSASYDADFGEGEDAPEGHRFDAGTALLFSSTASDATTDPDTLVVIVRPLTEDEADAEVGPMYLVSDKDGTEHHVFEDELSAPPSIIHTLPEDWNGAPLA